MPRRVWYTPSPLPPKRPVVPAERCWSRISVMMAIDRMIWTTAIIDFAWLNEVDDKVYCAHNQSREDKGGNGLNGNTSMDEVKLGEVREVCGEPEDECVHDDEAEAERDDNQRAEDERDDGLEDKIEDREHEAEQDEAEDGRGEHEAGDKAVREPEREGVADRDEDEF